MKCSGCGAELPTSAKFCPKCGCAISIFTIEVIQAAKKNDQAAITQLYNETYNNVYQTVKAIIKADEDTVLDIVQDTYIRAFKYLDQLDKPENFRAWIKRIGANTAKNYLKKKKPILFSQLEKDDEEPQEFQFRDERPDHMPEVAMDQKETQRLIGEILDTLSDDQRLAITMFYFDEMSVKEIAEELGCSENTVKSRLNYGRKKVETKVRELEKKGTKLYSLAPLPFLLFLFHTEEASAAALPSAQVLHGIQAGIAGSTAKGVAGKATATTVKGGLKATATKVVAGVAATAVVGTAGVAVYNNQTNAAKEEFIQSYEYLQENAYYEAYDSMDVFLYDTPKSKKDWDVVVVLKNKGEENNPMKNYAIMNDGNLKEYTLGDSPTIVWVTGSEIHFRCIHYNGFDYTNIINFITNESRNNLNEADIVHGEDGVIQDIPQVLPTEIPAHPYDLYEATFDDTGYKEILKNLK